MLPNSFNLQYRHIHLAMKNNQNSILWLLEERGHLLAWQSDLAFIPGSWAGETD